MADTRLLQLLPPIRRARDFRLYAEDGRRLVDLWQYGGAALLGHTPPGLLRAFKNTAGRGLFAPLPGRLEGRVLRALAGFFPGRTFRLYGSGASLFRALAAGTPVSAVPPVSVPDPALPAWEPGFCSLWRPFLDFPGTDSGAPETAAGKDAGPAAALPAAVAAFLAAIPLLVPVLPLPWTGAPRILALDPAQVRVEAFPPSDIISPVYLAAAARALCDLKAALPLRGVSFAGINRALHKSPWRRRGIYLVPGEVPGEAAYEKLFRRFLEGGFLLPPDRKLPAILPGALSAGEEAQLAALLF
ncbi:MAG: hypothetical protein LBJ24_01760 [Treponema sp.]|jgi:hypothetical protein|nr:hypothetical protein [Treponema sp.]